MAWYGNSHPNARIAIIAPTYGDARDTCIEGDSGLLSVLPKVCIKAWNRSLGELILWNDTRYKLFAAEEPERLRGPQHHRAWADEVAAWRYAEAWDQLLFGLRLGDNPQVVATTTPKPNALTRRLAKTRGAAITRGSTFDNADNLARAALDQLRERYAGTRLGRQELDAEILDDAPGALWTRAVLDANRRKANELPEMARVVVAIDPSGTDGNDDGDEVGIVVAGRGVDGRGYVMADLTCQLSPEGWARRAVTGYYQHEADRIVAERNFGGAMVESVIRSVDRSVPYKEVVASRGKALRAEPISAMFEQGRCSTVEGMEELEDELVMMTASGYTGAGSPNRLDAMVWALTELMLSHQPKPRHSGKISIPSTVTAFGR